MSKQKKKKPKYVTYTLLVIQHTTFLFAFTHTEIK